MTTTGKRQRRSPGQRAEEALGVAERLVDKLDSQRKVHQAAINKLTPLIEEAKRRRDYLAKHPDLPVIKETVAQPIVGDSA